jgi:hypothetical protein
VSTAAIILACIAFMLVVGMIRGNPGRSVADTAFLVMLVGIITIADFAFGQFMDTGDAGKLIAIAFAAAFAVDALYGLMAPERQKRRDRKLRRLMKRRA